MKIADLYAEVGFKFDSVKLREVGKYIGDLNVSSIIAATSITGLGLEIKSLIDSSAQLSSNLTTLHANTGIDNDFSQKFEKAAKALGSSKEAADGLISSLSKIRQSIKFGGSVPRGLSLLGINYQDITGPEEALISKINKILSQKPKLDTQAQKESWASFLSSINADLGATPDLLKALSNPSLFNTMHQFITLSQKDIDANVEATKQWVVATENLNTELMKTADKILPSISNLLKSFNENGGLQKVANVLQGISDTIYKASLIFDIAGTYAKAAALNIGSYGSKPLIAASENYRLGQEYYKSKQNNVTVNVAPITIHANDPQEFTRKFDDHFKKYMGLTSSQFTLGQR